MNKILISVAAIATIIDILLRQLENIEWGILTKPLVSLNMIEILIALLIVVLIYRLPPSNINRLYFQKRAKNFYKSWKEFKHILEKYQQQKAPDLQNKYKKIREKLLDDFNFFLPTIKSIKHRPFKDTEDIALTNLENCLVVNNIVDWFNKVKRRVPEELDCFDCFIASLEGYYRNPKYYQ